MTLRFIIALQFIPFLALSSFADGPPTVPPAHAESARRATAAFVRGDFSEAERTYEAILADVPDNLFALSNLGVIRFRVGKLKQAEETFHRAVANTPGDEFCQCTLGIVLYARGKNDEAVTALTKALSINPKNATAREYLHTIASPKVVEGKQGDFRTPLEKSRLDPP